MASASTSENFVSVPSPGAPTDGASTGGSAMKMRARSSSLTVSVTPSKLWPTHGSSTVASVRFRHALSTVLASWDVRPIVFITLGASSRTHSGTSVPAQIARQTSVA